MYIINDNNCEELESVTLILTRSEMVQLAGYSKRLLESQRSADHVHLSDEDYEKEITICIFNGEDLKSFDPRIQKIIKKENE